MKRNALLLGLLMGGTVFNSAALTVGRVRGAAWIGQPLSVSVPVQLDSGSTDTNLCAEADVYYADALKDPSRVRVQQTPSAQVNTHIVQIDSAVTIDEPMVTVYLRVGCGQKVARRYVMLADYPSLHTSTDASEAVLDAVATSTAVDTPAELQATTLDTAAPPPVADTAAEVAEAAKAPRAKQQGQRKVERSKSAQQQKTLAQPNPVVQAPAVSAKSSPAPVQSPTSPQRPRLKLDPLENLSERIKTLETTTTAIPLEDIVRDAQRIQQLQGDVKKLLEQAAKNEATLTQMRERLEKAEADRASTTLVYALAALVLACLAALAVLWNRLSPTTVTQYKWSSSPKYEDEDEDDEVVPPPRVPSVPPTEVAATKPVTVAATAAPRPESTLEMELVEMDVAEDAYSALAEIPITPSTAPTQSDSVPLPMLGAAVSVYDFNSESQFDLRQQAEYFDSLGKTDEAIEMLENRIRANSKDCPLVYLELLRIANVRNLKTDFRQFRDECMQAFNVAVPEFALFRSEGSTLDAYPDLLAHIEKLWSSPKALEVLESCIIRDPWEKNAKPFDLAAFKELVMLHGLASRAEPLPLRANAATAPNSKGANDATASLGIDLEL